MLCSVPACSSPTACAHTPADVFCSLPTVPAGDNYCVAYLLPGDVLKTTVLCLEEYAAEWDKDKFTQQLTLLEAVLPQYPAVNACVMERRTAISKYKHLVKKAVPASEALDDLQAAMTLLNSDTAGVAAFEALPEIAQVRARVPPLPACQPAVLNLTSLC